MHIKPNISDLLLFFQHGLVTIFYRCVQSIKFSHIFLVKCDVSLQTLSE